MSISVPSLHFPCFYYTSVQLPLGEHVFPAQKYAGIAALLEREGLWQPNTKHLLHPASKELLQLVHTPHWTSALVDGTIRYEEVLRLEIPYSKPLIDAFRIHATGSVLAAEYALKEGAAFHIGGGFHHAFPGHGEGFCALHDVAIAIRHTQHQGLIQNALVIDTDVHQGNGTAAIFAKDPTVFTFSIHQENNYPAIKPHSDLDVGLEDGLDDQPYLDALEKALEHCFQKTTPQLIAYVAGSDPYREDKLGGLNLSIEGMYERDLMVARAATQRGIPIFVTLAGGYAQRFNDTLRLHANTALALAAASSQSPAYAPLR
jgi:acetoin utilization deacetylase AcuC-like enzyme